MARMLSAFFTGHLQNRLKALFSGKIQTRFMNKKTPVISTVVLTFRFIYSIR